MSRLRQIFEKVEVIEEVVADAIEDRYRQGVVLLELKFWPTFFTGHGHSYEKVLGAIQRGVREGRRRCQNNIDAGLLCTVPMFTEDDFIGVTHFAIENKEAFVGETDCVELLREVGLKLTMELAGDQLPDNPAAVIESLRPSRIYGDIAIKDAAARQLMEEMEIALELRLDFPSDREVVTALWGPIPCSEDWCGPTPRFPVAVTTSHFPIHDEIDLPLLALRLAGAPPRASQIHQSPHQPRDCGRLRRGRALLVQRF
ncbi:unnamed protein product [Vitrella brassicaformis CCMP3155]|uniref:Uncharacterized protein n=1 Tax=Vitrella brassicaformis (strain CCMP3155) TaxID=1169540 RepID=A0A0G4FSS6_VITBC|nr:unnamed protein product [Vitrella brassicaformis CCMP3155]|eukprot:CEM17496.1 unnamed protein product [Vitrella brassicaformis CCMP3155]